MSAMVPWKIETRSAVARGCGMSSSRGRPGCDCRYDTTQAWRRRTRRCERYDPSELRHRRCLAPVLFQRLRAPFGVGAVGCLEADAGFLFAVGRGADQSGDFAFVQLFALFQRRGEDVELVAVTLQ